MSGEGIVLSLGGYLVGSIPTGVILAKLFSVRNIRKEGSGNIGATNVFRVLGAKLGLLTLVGDVAKGSIAVILASYLAMSGMWIATVAFFTFLGHLYSIFLGFHGGKGVATALGIFLVVAPITIPLAVLVFILVVMKWKYVSLGSLTASTLMPLFLYLAGYPLVYVNLSVLMGCFIFYRHRDNIKRLRRGSEKKIAWARG